MMKKFRFFSSGIVIFTVVIFSLSSIGGIAADKPYVGTTITFIGEAVPPTEALVKLIPNFEKQTGIKVEVEMYPYNVVTQKEMLDVTSQEGYYDVISIPYQALGKFVENNYIVSIDKYLRNSKFTPPEFDLTDIIESMWKASSNWKGKYYGFPSNSCTMFMWYRKDLLENPEEKTKFKKIYGYELGVPKNWCQYRDVAEFFTRKAAEKLAGETLKHDFYGVAIAGKRHDALTCEWLNYAWSFKGGVFDGKGYKPENLIINSPENVQALQYFVSLFRFAPPGCPNYTWDEVTTAFQQNRVALAIQWNDQAFGVEDPTKSKVAGKMNYGQVPVKAREVSHFGSWSYTINAFSKNKDAAYLFMEWALSPKIDLKWARMGGIPCRKSTYADPELIEKIPFWKATEKALEVAVDRPRIPEWSELNSEMMLALSQAIAGTKTCKEALDWLYEKYVKILSR